MSEWVEKPLGQLAKFQKGRKVATADYQQAEYDVYLGASSLGGAIEGYASTKFAVLAEPNNVLMLWDGERSGLVGHGLHGVVSSTVQRLMPGKEITGTYLYYHLLSRFDWIQGRRTGTGVPHVPKDLARILNVKYPVNPIEQERITDVLASIDKAIEKTEVLIAKYQQIKAGLMHDLFTRGVTADGKLRPPREQAPELYQETPIGWIPKEWEVGSLAKFLIGGPKNGYSPPEVSEWSGFFSLGLGCLTASGFRPRQIKVVSGTSDAACAAIVNDGDLLLSRSNTRELVGLCGIYRDIGGPCIYPDLMMRIKPNEKTSAAYLEALLLSPKMRLQIAAAAVGTSGSMVKLNSKSVLRLDIRMPKPDEQMQILRIIEAQRGQLESFEEEFSKLRQQKSGLMSDLLTGRVRVKLAETEVVPA